MVYSFFKGEIMRIEVINEKRLNHIHYCRVHKENQQLSGSFWVPSKSKSKNKKMFSIELNDRNFLVCDPEHIFKQKISGNKPSECILNLMNILIQEDMKFLQKLEMKLERKIKLDKPYDVKALKLAKTLFPFFLRLLKIKRIISGGKINIINNCYYNKNEKPVIFAITHVGKYDIERVYEALNEHSILLFGTPEDVHGTFDGFMLEKILVNYLDINDKEDRKVVSVFDYIRTFLALHDDFRQTRR